jgi:Lipocalin-like domain
MSDNPLAGTWRLQHWEITYGDGRASTLPYGREPEGFLLYTADGFMSGTIARAHRPPLSSESVRQAPEAERLAAFESFFQYAGPYELRRGTGPTGVQVVHRVQMALNPNFVGSEQVRDVHLEDGGKQLTLSASDTVPGSTVARHHRLVWQRAVPAARAGAPR